MYLQNFGLSRVPFSLESDPDFFWPGGGPAAALSALQRAFAQNHAFSLLTGDPGSGKTLLLNRFRDTLPPGVDVAAIPNPALDIRDLYQIIFSELDMGSPPSGAEGARDALRSRLHAGRTKNRRVVIILIDEAQRMPVELVRELAKMSATISDAPLLNVFMAAQTGFPDLLGNSDKEWLLARLGTRHHLGALNEHEIGAYIRHRLKTAGAAGELFHPDALRAISCFCEGLPRVINLLCDHALLTGYIAGDQEIGPGIVNRCAAELELAAASPEPTQPRRKRQLLRQPSSTRPWARSAAWAAAALVAVAGAWIGLQPPRVPARVSDSEIYGKVLPSEAAQESGPLTEAAPSPVTATPATDIASHSPPTRGELSAANSHLPVGAGEKPTETDHVSATSPELGKESRHASEVSPANIEEQASDSAAPSFEETEEAMAHLEAASPWGTSKLETRTDSRSPKAEDSQFELESAPASEMAKPPSDVAVASPGMADESLVARETTASSEATGPIPVDTDSASNSPSQEAAGNSLGVQENAAPSGADSLSPVGQSEEDDRRTIAAVPESLPEASKAAAENTAVYDSKIPTPPPPPENAEAGQSTFRIFFRPGSAEIDPGSYHSLRQMADYLKSQPGMNLFIEAHPEANSKYASNLYNFRVSALKSFLAGSSIKAAILPVPEPDAGVSPMGVRAELQDAG
jgi:type II secretory pathway predicted ATPase ExeA/outer membrane protein OmpA-like peptidoglycan-associated protein